MPTTRTMSREIGTAFAVLAIYLLTVLAPLHHARASQLAFEQLGYSTTQSSWVLCTPAGAESEDRDVLVAKCPATGVGKAEFVLPSLNALPVRHEIAIAAPLPAKISVGLPRPIAPPAGARAPPVPV